MFLFDKTEIEKLRKKAEQKPYVFSLLQKEAVYPVETNLIVPKVGRGNWGMYYCCAKDAHILKFDWQKPKEHICPVCGTVYSGEPFDGAWETNVHSANAATALRKAYLYLLTQETTDAAVAERILTGYAENYPNYREHGDIPYNGPGLAFAQTLDESVFLRRLGYAYDLISDTLSDEKKELICENLFRIGAKFLLGHRTKQIHNHEVLINSTIGILGLILDDELILKKGLYDPFALLDQRKRGVLSDDFWFEGTISYHQYALNAFFSYEIFARHTRYSHLDDLQYLRMAKKPIDYISDDYTMPALNDSRCLGHKFTAELAQEFGYYYYRDTALLELLHLGYQNGTRESIDAFFYGAEELPPVSVKQSKNYHDVYGSGLTIFRGRQKRYLLVKHSPFGGEHDHYDRLGISFSAFGDQMCSDLGTVPYGVSWHYDYYKNTGSHNTVMVEEENQPPQKCRVNEYRCENNSVFLDCSVKWDKPYIMTPPSFTIKQWKEEEYAGTYYRRQILWKENYFIDVVTVNHPEERCTDWILHVDGEQELPQLGKRVERFSEKKPFCYLSNVQILSKTDMHIQEWRTPHGHLRLFSMGTGIEFYTAKGANLPPDGLIDYTIQRRRAKECLFVNVFETYQKSPALKNVKIHKNRNQVIVEADSETMVFDICRGL